MLHWDTGTTAYSQQPLFGIASTRRNDVTVRRFLPRLTPEHDMTAFTATTTRDEDWVLRKRLLLLRIVEISQTPQDVAQLVWRLSLERCNRGVL